MNASLQTTTTNPSTIKVRSDNPFLKSNATAQIPKFLNFKELISFEMVASGHKDITHQAWKFLRFTDYATATFSDCEKEKHQEKFNYALAVISAMSLYNPHPTLDEAIATEKRFSFFMHKPNRFKLFGAYLEKIIRFKRKTLQSDPPKLVQKLRSLEEIAFQGCVQGKWSGDILLQAKILLHFNNGWSEQSFRYAIQAIKNGACNEMYDEKYSQTHLTISMELSTKKYFRCLEDYLTKPDLTLPQLEEIEKKYGSHPPLLWKIFQIKSSGMSDQEKADKFEKLLDETYDGYGVRASKEFLLTLAEIKGTLLKWTEAEKLYDKITTSFNCNFNEPFFLNMIRMKILVFKYKEADELINQLLKLPNPSDIYDLALIGKFYQSDFEKSESFIPLYKLTERPIKFYIQRIAFRILLKLQLGKNSEAEEYIKGFLLKSEDLENDIDYLVLKVKNFTKNHGKLKDDIVESFLNLLQLCKNSMPEKVNVIAKITENSVPASDVVQNVVQKRSLILTIFNIFSKIKFLCKR